MNRRIVKTVKTGRDSGNRLVDRANQKQRVKQQQAKVNNNGGEDQQIPADVRILNGLGQVGIALPDGHDDSLSLKVEQRLALLVMLLGQLLFALCLLTQLLAQRRLFEAQLL